MIGKLLDWLIWNPRTHLPRRGVDDPWIARDKLGHAIQPLCEVIGHDPQGDVCPVWSTGGPFLIPPGDERTADYSGYIWTDPVTKKKTKVSGCIQPYSGIVYFMRECSRCKKRIPVDGNSEANKMTKDDEINSVMNGARAQYGLPPIDFSR